MDKVKKGQNNGLDDVIKSMSIPAIWEKLDCLSNSDRPYLTVRRSPLKFDVTDPALASQFHLNDEELDFMSRILDYCEMGGFFSVPAYQRVDIGIFMGLFGCEDKKSHKLVESVRLCQSSFDTYRHLADEDLLEEERKVFESEDLTEHCFYDGKDELFRKEKCKDNPCSRPEEINIYRRVSPRIEWLGCYLPLGCAGVDFPEIHFFMDNISKAAERIGCKRLYVVVAVFLHEMCHALFDRFPLSVPKPYIRQVEEPLAECLSLKILHAFVETSRLFYPDGSLLDMFDVAYAMVYQKRKFPKIAYYSLGRELFLCMSEADKKYYRYSYLLDESSCDVQSYVSQFAAGFPANPYVAVRMLEKMVNYKYFRNGKGRSNI